MPLALGTTMADFTFQKPDGADVQLREFRGRPLLVVFLRHLA
jgi:peroxiredoxin